MLSEQTWAMILRRLHYSVLGRVPNPADREDLVQEAVIVTLAKKELPDATVYSFVSEVLRRLLLHYGALYQKEKRRHSEFDFSALLSPTDLESAYEEDELKKCVKEAVRLLSPSDQALYALILEGCNSAEIAERLGISPDSLWKRRQRLKDHLIKILKPTSRSKKKSDAEKCKELKKF